LQRFQTRQQRKEMHNRQKALDKPVVSAFDYAKVPKSTTVHLDYTGPLSEVGSNGTRVFMITTWGRYIHIQPLTNLRDEATTTALKEAILFWRNNGISIDSVRMDNQCSNAFQSGIRPQP
jgi:hypothetical protein